MLNFISACYPTPDLIEREREREREICNGNKLVTRFDFTRETAINGVESIKERGFKPANKISR